MIEKLLSVFALAIFEMSAAIPLGFHLNVHPGLLVLVTIVGALVGVVAATFLGEKLRSLIFWRKKDKAGGSSVSRWLTTKGPWAVGLLGPVLIGPIFAAGLAATLGMPRRSSVVLLGVGIVAWTLVFVALGVLGLSALR